MKRILFYMTIVALVMGTLSFFVSCSNNAKNDAMLGGQHFLLYSFQADDQINLKQYEIEVSLSGDINGQWEEAYLLFPDNNGLSHSYSASVDVTKWMKDHKTIYSRIKSVDIDGTVKYYPISVTTRP